MGRLSLVPLLLAPCQKFLKQRFVADLPLCAQGKQKIVVELYDKFFRNAFPKMTERLGIVLLRSSC
jgi:hypothetical protein